MKNRLIIALIWMFVLPTLASATVEEDVATHTFQTHNHHELTSALMHCVSAMPLVDVKGSRGLGVIIGVIGPLYQVPDSQASVAALIWAHIISRVGIEQRPAMLCEVPDSEQQYFDGAKFIAGMGWTRTLPVDDPLYLHNTNPKCQKIHYMDDAYSLICNKIVAMPSSMGGTRTISSVVDEVMKKKFNQ